MREINIPISLKPCPFCGGGRQRVKPLWKGEYRFVACLDCKAAGPVARTEEQAIDAWNGRREPSQPSLFGGES